MGRRRFSFDGIAVVLVSVVAGLVAAIVANPVGAQSLQRCKIAHPTVSFVVPSLWGCESGSPSGLRFEAQAPGQTAFIDLYTAPKTANLDTLLTTAVKAHGLARSGTRLQATSAHATLAGQKATTYSLHFPGVFDNAESGEVSYSIYALTRNGMTYVIAYSSVDPWAAKDQRDFAAFIASLRFA